MKRLVTIVITILLYFSYGIVVASEIQEDEEAFATFETYCLSNINNPGNIETMMSSAGNKPLSQEMASAILAPQKGKAWLVKKGVSVAVTVNGVCTVTAPYVNGDKTKNLFQKYVKNIKIASEPMGSQVQDVYAVVHPNLTGDLSKMIVLITTTNLKSIDGIIFNALPERMATENNIHVPNWPE